MGTSAKGAQPPQNPAFLDERCREANQSLTLLYKDLNEKWESIEQKFRSLVPPQHVWFSYRSWEDDPYQPQGTYHLCLGLVKHRGDWRICRGMYYDLQEGSPDSWKPIVECSVEERLEAVEFVDRLREEIVSSAEKSIPKVNAAAAKLAKALERL